MTPIPDGRGLRLGIVTSRFNDNFCTALLDRARAEASRLGVSALRIESVPGALEIPLALRWMADSGEVDALVALGVVMRGETYHFEIVSDQSARGVLQVSLDTGLPIANGILTTENEAQTEARLDKGAEAVRVAVEMARLKMALRSGAAPHTASAVAATAPHR